MDEVIISSKWLGEKLRELSIDGRAKQKNYDSDELLCDILERLGENEKVAEFKDRKMYNIPDIEI